MNKSIKRIPDRESSCETKRTCLDFMKVRGLGGVLVDKALREE